MKIQESAEMYLETILILSRRLGEGQVRSIDVANEMGFSKPSISGQMKKFRENAYIRMDEEGYITLNDSGREIAERIYERHNIIAQIFISIGVDEATAYQDACKVEHYISEQTFCCLREHFSRNNN